MRLTPELACWYSCGVTHTSPVQSTSATVRVSVVSAVCGSAVTVATPAQMKSVCAPSESSMKSAALMMPSTPS